jgi:hypothetical protein
MYLSNLGTLGALRSQRTTSGLVAVREQLNQQLTREVAYHAAFRMELGPTNR